VRTDVTGAALVDMWKEIEGMRAKPMDAAELKRVRNAQLLSLPGLFDTNLAVVAGYAGNWSSGLPLSTITELPKQYGAVTSATALQAAQRYLDPAQLIVVAVGDKGKVLPQLQAIGRKAEVRDTEGRPAQPAQP
jgi:zinc protease